MRHLFLFCLLGCLLMSETTYAQKRGRKRSTNVALGPTFGFKLGPSFSTMGGTGASKPNNLLYGSESIEYSSIVGVVAGGVFNYRFSPQGSLQIEALYAMRGFKRTFSYKAGATGPFDDQTVRTSYIDVPIMGKFSAQVFYLEAGLVPSLLVSATAGSTSNGKDNPSGDAINELTKFDTGIGFGAGLELPNGAFFGLRWIRGFQAIGSKNSNKLNLTGEGLNNSSFQFTGGYLFGHATGRGGRRRH